MAIFIALIFQVLFVLFAMAINVALVVHDKINLQNAVDLAAYYAAERQAEILNVIAHENYMIRQSWKLLAWRYRVLGASGVQTPMRHPVESGSLQDVPFVYDGGRLDPAVCVIHARNWLNVDTAESLCKQPNVNIPPLPQVPVIAGFLPFNFAFASLAARLRNQQADNCNIFGAYNWWFAAASLQAFRQDQHNRKQVIYALASNLNNRPGPDFIDLNGSSVEAGTYKTYVKNLTYANTQAQTEFQMFNSLRGLRRDQWLPDVEIAPIMTYIDPSPGAGCIGGSSPVSQLPQRSQAQSLALTPLASGGLGLQDLAPWMTTGSGYLPNNPYQYSMGVEKNPWAMVYVGVRAETAPRQIFFPFGNAIRMTARAYAKPFGGRIGPWYGSRWSRGSDRSTGADTDSLVAPRLAAGGIMNSPQDPRRLPNYSRFPGDQLGLRSQLALNGLAGLAGLRSPNDVFQHIWLPMQTGGYNDILAFDTFTNTIPAIRKLEIAAVSPDLFDVTYYSIEPNFGVHYLPKLIANRTQLGIPNNVVLRGDLGMNQILNNMTFSVQNQIEVAAGTTSPPPVHRPQAYYFIRDKTNLLTAWASGEMPFEYGTFPVDRFGRCAMPDDPYQANFKVPGSCLAQGGRTGYSVKLISRDYLYSTGHPIGGDGEAPGALINPPPTGTGW
ncbi:MAG: Tad domain-containing protein [Bdellovibrionales bacterium]